MNSKLTIGFFFSLLFFMSASTFSQEFGFGCFGLPGGFAGYELQSYEPTGINTYVTSFNTFYAKKLQNKIPSFSQLRGFRLGLNLIRRNFEGVQMTVKGYYVNLSEKNKATIANHDTDKSLVTLEMLVNNFGIGVDFGLSVSKSISWKVLEGAIFLNRVTFSETENSTKRGITQNSYKNGKFDLGYSIGSGFIFFLIQDFVSLETNVDYAIWTVGKVHDGAGNGLLDKMSGQPAGDLVTYGGINFVLQLNLSIPL